MADANLKPRRKRTTPPDRTLAAQLIYAPTSADDLADHDAKIKAAFPWMWLAGEALNLLGFKPGDRVNLSFNYAHQSLTISQDSYYRIAGRPMTEQEIERREADYAALFDA